MNSVVSERSKNEVFGGQGKSPGAALTPRRFFFFFSGWDFQIYLTLPYPFFLQTRVSLVKVP